MLLTIIITVLVLSFLTVVLVSIASTDRKVSSNSPRTSDGGFFGSTSDSDGSSSSHSHSGDCGGDSGSCDGGGD